MASKGFLTQNIPIYNTARQSPSLFECSQFGTLHIIIIRVKTCVVSKNFFVCQTIQGKMKGGWHYTTRGQLHKNRSLYAYWLNVQNVKPKKLSFEYITKTGCKRARKSRYLLYLTCEASATRHTSLNRTSIDGSCDFAN